MSGPDQGSRVGTQFGPYQLKRLIGRERQQVVRAGNAAGAARAPWR